MIGLPNVSAKSGTLWKGVEQISCPSRNITTNKTHHCTVRETVLPNISNVTRFESNVLKWSRLILH